MLNKSKKNIYRNLKELMGDPEVATHSKCLRLRMMFGSSYGPFLCFLSFNDTTTEQSNNGSPS